jgi:hypothetical protein
MPDDDQLERFGEAVEQKKQEAKARSEETGEQHAHGSPVDGDQPGLTDAAREQDVRSPRDKNSAKGKMTADKWNQ